MAANAETMEVLLQVSFGRGIKYLSTPINDPQYDQALQRGEKLCLASLKCFTVGATKLLVWLKLISSRDGCSTPSQSSKNRLRN
jgi:hypothetical protein